MPTSEAATEPAHLRRGNRCVQEELAIERSDVGLRGRTGNDGMTPVTPIAPLPKQEPGTCTIPLGIVCRDDVRRTLLPSEESGSTSLFPVSIDPSERGIRIDEHTPSRAADAEERELTAEAESVRGLPAESTDGIAFPLYLNTGLINETGNANHEDCAGIGLYRTELPFMVRDRFPAESVQVMNYRRVLEAFSPRPVILRTLDIGGDKPLPYFPIVEQNPFLGWRGVRISLAHPEIFLTQVRAMLRAAVDLDNLQIMLPMISGVTEVDELKMLIKRAHDELLEEGYAVSMPNIGVMIEVPSAVYMIEELARRVDFVSVGTNDLTQYLLAVDRNNSRVADLYDDLHPAVLRALDQVVRGARTFRRPVGVCGELAGNPMATILLMGLGVDSLSMSAGSLMKVKWVVRSFSVSRARQLLHAALRMEDALQVRRFMEGALDDMGLGGLFRPGR